MLARRAALSLVGAAAFAGAAQAAPPALPRAASPRAAGLAEDRLGRLPAWFNAEIAAPASWPTWKPSATGTASSARRCHATRCSASPR
jgi:hypothetical protein